jgi:hypothetical protein
LCWQLLRQVRADVVAESHHQVLQARFTERCTDLPDDARGKFHVAPRKQLASRLRQHVQVLRPPAGPHRRTARDVALPSQRREVLADRVVADSKCLAERDHRGPARVALQVTQQPLLGLSELT